MTEQFRRDGPGIPVVRGDGDTLPFADDTADFITYAQSWHWTRPAHAAREALRVLRPGGTLALWWNVSDESVPWVAEQTERVTRHFGVDAGAHGSYKHFSEAPGLDFAHRRIPWSRRVSLDHHLANLASHSVFLVLGEEKAKVFLDAERAVLREFFPGGTVEEPYYVDLLTARKPTP